MMKHDHPPLKPCPRCGCVECDCAAKLGAEPQDAPGGDTHSHAQPTT